MTELISLSEAHAQQVDALCASCVDYYHEVTGLPPGPAEAQSLFLAVPPHGDYGRKRLWGVFECGHMYGLVDGAFGYPRDECFWIGLLMLEPNARRRGRGSQILQAVSEHARKGGAQTLSLAVKCDYVAAQRFWLSQGFETKSRRTVTMPGLGYVEFDIMHRAA